MAGHLESLAGLNTATAKVEQRGRARPDSAELAVLFQREGKRGRLPLVVKKSIFEKHNPRKKQRSDQERDAPHAPAHHHAFAEPSGQAQPSSAYPPRSEVGVGQPPVGLAALRLVLDRLGLLHALRLEELVEALGEPHLGEA